MRIRPCRLLTYFLASVVGTFAFSTIALAQSSTQQAAAKSASSPAPKRDLSGVWQYQGSGGAESMVPDKDMPPMTPWAKARFDAEKPGYGPRGAPGGNDPILQCDPIGFPRIMFMPTPFELIQTHDRVLQFFEREHAWRPIWLDGRSIPEDSDPTWFGYVERYHRIDHDTIQYNMTVTDPTAYSQAIVVPQKIMKLKPHGEIEEQTCVWSQENAFAKRIREPAAAKPAK